MRSRYGSCVLAVPSGEGRDHEEAHRADRLLGDDPRPPRARARGREEGRTPASLTTASQHPSSGSGCAVGELRSARLAIDPPHRRDLRRTPMRALRGLPRRMYIEALGGRIFETHDGIAEMHFLATVLTSSQPP